MQLFDLAKLWLFCITTEQQRTCMFTWMYSLRIQDVLYIRNWSDSFQPLVRFHAVHSDVYRFHESTRFRKWLTHSVGSRDDRASVNAGSSWLIQTVQLYNLDLCNFKRKRFLWSPERTYSAFVPNFYFPLNLRVMKRWEMPYWFDVSCLAIFQKQNNRREGLKKSVHIAKYFQSVS